MEAWQWAVVVLVVVVVLALVLWLVLRQRRQAKMRQRFGPEYDRAIEQHGSRRTAEADLSDRARRHERLELQPLSPEARGRYQDQWRGIQSRFVDEPEAAIIEADSLLDRVMRDRGYPVEDFDEKADLVSVDHPGVVENYRAARAVRERNTRNLASTEDLRDALLRYRSLFDEMLETAPGDRNRGREDDG